MEKKYKMIMEYINELKEDIQYKKTGLIPRDVEVEYIKAEIELLKIEAVLIINKEIKKSEEKK